MLCYVLRKPVTGIISGWEQWSQNSVAESNNTHVFSQQLGRVGCGWPCREVCPWVWRRPRGEAATPGGPWCPRGTGGGATPLWGPARGPHWSPGRAGVPRGRRSALRPQVQAAPPGSARRSPRRWCDICTLRCFRLSEGRISQVFVSFTCR